MKMNESQKGSILGTLVILAVIIVSLLLSQGTLLKFKQQGKRNTYCDYLRHLKHDHHKEDLDISDCIGGTLTDLQKKLQYEKN